MSIYLTAQIIGFLGYLFLVSGPTFKEIKNIIRTDILACILLSVQWIMLEQPSLLILNVLNIILSICALGISQKQYFKKAMVLFYPIGGLTLLSVSNGTIIDVFCMLGFFGLVASKTSHNITQFRGFAIVSSSAFIMSGALALSIPAVLFNLVRISLHIKTLMKITHAVPKVIQVS